MQRRVIVDRFQREADIGQHALDHPAEGRVFVAHMGDHALALEIVVLDGEIRPLLDVALGAVGHADEDDVAQVEIGAGLQRGVDPCQRHRLPEIRQMMQREFADDQVIGIRLVGEAQHAGRLGADRHLAVAGLDVGERQHRRRNIDRVDFGAHQRRLAGQHAVAAADIGHPPALLHAEHGQRRAGAEVAVVMPVVDRGDRGIEPELPPLIVIPVPRQHGSHPFRPAPDRGNAGARHLDKAERAHQVDELIDLGGVACDLEHKALGGGVDHAGAERIRQPQRLDAVVAAAAHLHHREFPLDRAAGDRHVDDAIDRHHAVELVLDLLDHHRRARGDDGDAGEVFLALGLGDRETLDVVAAAGEQPDHAREHARLVLHQHRERVRLVRIVTLFQEIGGCGLVHCRPLECLSSSRHRPLTAAADGIRSPTHFRGTDRNRYCRRTGSGRRACRQFVLLLQRRGQRGRAGAFGEIVRVGPVGAHRRGDLVVRDLHDARGALADDRERLGIGNARRHAVGQRVAGLGGHDRAGRERQRVGRRFGRLHADDLGLAGRADRAP